MELTKVILACGVALWYLRITLRQRWTMMVDTDTLTLINETLGPHLIPTDCDAVAGVQYGTGGLGTLVLEGTMDEVTWFAIGMVSPADHTTAVASLAAAGAGYANVGYCKAVRVRKSVAGAGGVLASLVVNYY